MAEMRSVKSVSLKAALILMVVGVVMVENMGRAEAQSCSSELTNLNVCAPYVVPGSPITTPSVDCCGALQAVQHDCLCNTLRIASTLPTLCHLPPLSCDIN